MAILYGTQSNGETLPVLVDQFGNLIAKGIDGAQGIPGPIGPPGVGELPPGATDGALLGWQNGELVWVTEPLPPVDVSGFRPVIYDGNGATQSITTGFSPALVWVKCRDAAYDSELADTLRAGYGLSSNLSASQFTTKISLTSNGFDLTGGDDGYTNGSGRSYVAWCWDGGDTTVINNEGTIESQVRSNGEFSVVQYFPAGGPTNVGHGLVSAPAFVLIKDTTATSNWTCYHQSLGNKKAMFLNLNNAADENSVYWNNTDPTDKVLNLGSASGVSAANATFIAYCWATTPGASHFGSYQSTGMRTMIHVGFLPSMVIIKSISTGNWFMFDNARGTQYALRANEAAEEDEIAIVEFKDDGFQLLFAFPGVNTENETYIYAAFANPEDAAFAQRQLRRQARQEERQQNETHLR